MKALITGIAGQDGSYLAELLLSKGYVVHGIIRRHSVAHTQTWRVNHIIDKLNLHYGDMTDFASLLNIIRNVKPDEVYNLAAQSHVKVSEETPIYTTHADSVGVINLLEIIKQYPCKMYQASTSECFGNESNINGFQFEETPMRPVSPYGAAKVFAHNVCTHYRAAYKLFICCGILFNHTSVRRGDTFVEQKIVKGLCDIKKGKIKKIELGLLTPKRDIGCAKEYVKSMHLMLQQKKPDDYIIATGKTVSIDEILTYVCKKLSFNKEDIYEINTKFLRAQELHVLKGVADKAFNILGWESKRTVYDILDEMITYQLKQ